MLLVNLTIAHLRFALLGGNPEVDCHVRHHGVHRNVVSTLCEVSETLTEWKSESRIMEDGRTYKDRCKTLPGWGDGDS